MDVSLVAVPSVKVILVIAVDASNDELDCDHQFHY